MHLGKTKQNSFRRNWELSFRYITFEMLLRHPKCWQKLDIRIYSSREKLRLGI